MLGVEELVHGDGRIDMSCHGNLLTGVARIWLARWEKTHLLEETADAFRWSRIQILLLTESLSHHKIEYRRLGRVHSLCVNICDSA